MIRSFFRAGARSFLTPRRYSSRKVSVLQSGLRAIQNLEGAQVHLYYLQCMAQASYMIHHDKNAFLVDPRRDIEAYLYDLESKNLSLKGIFLTHIHADFVSGHKELIDHTGAVVYMGPGVKDRCQFQLTELPDDAVVDVSDKFEIRALHTPGHTPESMTFVLVNKLNNKTPLAAFTGDTLFIGSVGRPDLVGSLNFTAEEMSRLMYDSLEKKIKTLPDDVVVYPAHGAGSPCGKNLSDDLWSSIGNEKQNNPALQFDAVEPFVKYLTTDQPQAPQYFFHDVELNLAGAPSVSETVEKCKWTKPSELHSILKSDTTVCVVDTRSKEEYYHSHIGKSLLFSMGGQGGTTLAIWEGNFAIWVGTLVGPSRRLAVIASEGQETEAVQRLARIGYQPEIVLDGGMKAWEAEQLPVDKSNLVEVRSEEQLTRLVDNDDTVLVDVRTASEYANNHIKSAINIPLSNLMTTRHDLNKTKLYVVYCHSGYRSSIAVSVLQNVGLQATDIAGGFATVNVCVPQYTATGQVCPNMRKTVDDLQAVTVRAVS
ncbi:uncharacterized protein LOC134196674 [Corticium candelabrum]|uniref:uncharacterized protein LOC134196674 n=1 Tax=Corticium candelabrum TaxID=121492 RepID=UPI002E25B041|nr:uncharacterized protein LOC134196674 [Corticium candelabrum]